MSTTDKKVALIASAISGSTRHTTTDQVIARANKLEKYLRGEIPYDLYTSKEVKEYIEGHQ